MDYLSIPEARARSGLRLVVSAGVPGPWGEAVKALLRLRSVPFAAVAQSVMEPNEDLQAWTGFRNAPVAILDDEPPVAGWLDTLMLAERLGTGPSLLPNDPQEQALCLGFTAQICGPRGLGWCRRLRMLWLMFGGDPNSGPVAVNRGYGLSEQAVADAPRHIIQILNGLAAQLHIQRQAGSDYLVGSRLSACDVYWAVFSLMFKLLSQDLSPFPDMLVPAYTDIEPEVMDALDPVLIEHRDRIFQKHLKLPLDY